MLVSFYRFLIPSLSYLPIGLKGGVNISLNPTNLCNSAIKLHVNWVPWFDSTSSGILTRDKMDGKTSETDSELTFFSGTVSGKSITKSVRVRKYL